MYHKRADEQGTFKLRWFNYFIPLTVFESLPFFFIPILRNFAMNESRTGPRKHIAPFETTHTPKKTASISSSGKCLDKTSKISINWPIVTFLMGIPSAAIISLPWIPIHRKTVLIAFIYLVMRSIAVTAGQLNLVFMRTKKSVY